MGARRDAEIEGVDLLPRAINYLLGRDPKNWRRGIQSYGRVRYRGVYAGIDLVYYGREGELEYDFVVAPAASPRDILLEFDGTTFSVDANGDLVGGLADGEIRMRRPSVYQEIAGVRVPIHGEWALTAGGRARFEIGDYDRTKPLVIDPMLAYSTYLGGSRGAGASGREGDDGATDIAVDAAGNAYVTGFTFSRNFPTTAGAFQTTFRAGGDAFVTKLDPTGSTLVYSTYIGGTGDETGQAIAVDGAGNAYVAGTTQSDDFPITPGAFQTTGGGPVDAFANDAFVAKLDATGSLLVYSSYVGGSDTDSIGGIAVDAAGNAYVTGSTLSGDFPTTPGALQTGPASGLPAPPGFEPSRYDAFVTKLNATGSALVYSTYLGGTQQDTTADICVDALGNAYVTGTTRSENFPTTPGASIIRTTACLLGSTRSGPRIELNRPSSARGLTDPDVPSVSTASVAVRKSVYLRPRARNFTWLSVWPSFGSKLRGSRPYVVRGCGVVRSTSDASFVTARFAADIRPCAETVEITANASRMAVQRLFTFVPSLVTRPTLTSSLIAMLCTSG